MMRLLSTLLLLLLGSSPIALAGETSPLMSRKVSLTQGRKTQCQTLWAKQTIRVGSVCLEADHKNPEQIIVGFRTIEGWKFDDIHFWVGRNITELPMDESEDPPVSPNLDLFSYIKDDLNGQHSHFGFIVKLWYLDFICPDSKGTEFVAAAHATVRARSAVRNGNQPTLQHAWAAPGPVSSAAAFSRSWLDFSFTLICDLVPTRPKDAPERHHANYIPS